MEQHMEQSRQGMPPTVRLTPLGTWVSGRVRRLANGGGSEKGYLDDGAFTTAAIAKLRNSVGHEIGDNPDVFAWTLPDTDDRAIRGYDSTDSGTPTPQEHAIYAAVTLFALHQQSIRDLSMHTDAGVSLGLAVGRMAYGNFNENGIRGMFDRLQTANSWKELTRHARGLIRLLRRERIAINYGMLAQDLEGLRSGRARANAVRLRWGRDFQRGYGAARASDDSNS